jgi:hypothetical protein
MMKQNILGCRVGIFLLAAVFSGCAPSPEQLAAREEKVRAACERQLSAAAAAKSLPDLQKAIEKTLAKVSSASALPLIQQTLERMIGEGQYGVVEQVTDDMISTGKKPELHALAFATQFKCHSAAKDWPKLQKAILNCATRLPDAATEPLLSQIFAALKRAQQLELLEKTSQQLYQGSLSKPRLLGLATTTWVGLCVEKDRQLLPASLEKLLTDKVPAENVAMLLDRYFYEMTENKEIMKKISVLGPKILAATQNKIAQESVSLRMLDSAFLTDNFDLAVAMLEKGVPGKDAEWHATTLPKVKGHLELAKNKPLEAIAYFRQFMTAWQNAKHVDEMDPTTGLVYNREWVLGRNAIRIAKIYASIPDEANQKKALKEAEEFFKVALTKVNPGSKELTALTQEIKAAGF